MISYNEFELTEDLIKLLRHSYVSNHLTDCEYGAAEIDPKRPYGNSDVTGDIVALLGWQDETDDDQARALHEQTPMALQIVLASGSFEPGTYRAPKYTRNWEKV